MTLCTQTEHLVCEQNFLLLLNNEHTLCGHTYANACTQARACTHMCVCVWEIQILCVCHVYVWCTHTIFVIICAWGSLAFLWILLGTQNSRQNMLLKKCKYSGLDSDHCRGWGPSSNWRMQILRTSSWEVSTVMGMMESLPTFGKMMSCR